MRSKTTIWGMELIFATGLIVGIVGLILISLGLTLVDKPKDTLETVGSLTRVEGATTYYNGEILNPDYTHDDTLIVFNALELNKLFAVDSLAPATDWEIRDALYKYAAMANRTYNSDYGLDVDSTGYRLWDGDRLVSHFPFDQNPVLDSVVFKDND